MPISFAATGIRPAPVLIPLAGASLDLWLANAQYYDSGAGGLGQVVTDYLSCTRASNGFATNLDGTLTSFASNTLRIGVGTGLLVEEARTNDVLWNQDLTNAAWTKTNMTAALDQTGPDGVANSASSILATAGNATVLQSITLASALRSQSAYVKRITGSGTINMTMDNGATWTAITVTNAWTLAEIPGQTLANPTVGFRIVTNGDKIAVDFVQNENTLGGVAFATSPIPTTTGSVARAADNVTSTGTLTTVLIGPPVSVVCDVKSPNFAKALFNRIIGSTNGDTYLQSDQADNRVVCYNGASVLTANFTTSLVSTGVKVGFSRDTGARTLVGDGGTIQTDADVSGPTDISPTPKIGTGFDGGVGRDVPISGYLRRLAAWNSRLADITLQGFTAP